MNIANSFEQDQILDIVFEKKSNKISIIRNYYKQLKFVSDESVIEEILDQISEELESLLNYKEIINLLS